MDYLFILLTLILTFRIRGSEIRIFNKYIPIPKNYICYKTNETIKIDGDINEKLWDEVNWTELFEDIEGFIKPAPKFKTKVKMRYNNEFFYVAAFLEEPHLVANFTENNSPLYLENDFEVFLDPSSSSHLYTEFEINPFNTIWGLLLINPRRDGENVVNPYPIPGLQTAIKLYGTLNDPSDIDYGWTVEIAFPWNVLRQFAETVTPPLNGDQWRVNFDRVEWKYDIIDGKYVKRNDTKEDNYVWSPQWEIEMHKPETFGFVQFSEKNVNEDIFNFNQDSWDIQNILFWIYELQKEFKINNGRYASSYKELLLSNKSFYHSKARKIFAAIKLNKIKLDALNGFDASIIHISSGKIAIWHIRADSKRWVSYPELIN
jgi:hypothetical protein